MEVAMPMVGAAMDCYEDMFKEITRKLYGEDGLPELSQTDRSNQQSQDRGLTPIDYDVDPPTIKPEEHLTAFGLAALMQNGFSSFQQHKLSPSTDEDKWIISEDNIPWTHSKIASYNSVQKLFRCAECDCVGYLPRVAEHWLGTHSNLRVFQCPQCPYESAWARCVRMHLTRQHNINTEEATDALLKNNPVLQEIARYLQRLKTRVENNCNKSQSSTVENFHTSSNSPSLNTNANRQSSTVAVQQQDTQNLLTTTKRYSCSYCPYATDRRDLFTRHENIHREEKPFQCYVCQKQFNRADHVKKHFLRMHREHIYDLNRIRRHPPKNASGMSYYQKYNSANAEADNLEESLNVGLSAPISVPNGFNNNINRSTPVSNANRSSVQVRNTKPNAKSNPKKKGEKRYSCCYCTWSGVDNWCLKRHMNTHLKPFICGLCDYKAARSERLATHVLKVHNKRACGKCSFLADDPQQLRIHQQEQHPLDQRNRTSSQAANALRNTSFSNSASGTTATFGPASGIKGYDGSATTALMQTNRVLHQNSEIKLWKSHSPKQHGAARLFNYMEASDGSDPECNSSCGPEDVSRLSNRIQSDFLEAGDVGGNIRREIETEVSELPLFMCQLCGFEFEDDSSLETHQSTHESPTSPAKKQKENVNPKHKYQCKYCSLTFSAQFSVIGHMSMHSGLQGDPYKRSRKQNQPKKIMNMFVNGMNKRSDAHKAKSCKKIYRCTKCKIIVTFNDESNFILHNYWKHSRQNMFRCEHCNHCFSHKYQVILHSSKVHSIKKTDPPRISNSFANNDGEHQFLLNSEITSLAAITSIQSLSDLPNLTSGVHKLGMFFEHSLNGNINNHMSLIIPTFPPNS